MKPRLFSELTQYIQQWIEANCEADDWIAAHVHPDLAEDMARAAACVADSAEKSQAYAIQQGALKAV